MQPLDEQGILYSATRRAKYLYEAFLSAYSVKKRSPRISITLFTDMPRHALCFSGVFDNVHSVPPSVSPPRVGDALLHRVCALQQTPYERTLYLDTDTIVLTSELHLAFEQLQRVDVAMAEESIEISYTRLFLKRRMFNGGVILYRKAPIVSEWLVRWAEISEKNFRAAEQPILTDTPYLRHVEGIANRRKLLRSDQTSLTEIFSPEVNPFGLAFEPLDRCWNYRTRDLHDFNAFPPGTRIAHGRYARAHDQLKALESAMEFLRG